MCIEETHLFLHGLLDGNASLDVLLGSIFDTDETKTKLDFLIHDHALGVCASVHDINLGDDTDSSNTLRINSTSHSKTFLGGHISVSSDYTENDSSAVTHISLSHASSDLLDVLRLTLNGHESDTWQIN